MESAGHILKLHICPGTLQRLRKGGAFAAEAVKLLATHVGGREIGEIGSRLCRTGAQRDQALFFMAINSILDIPSAS